MDKKAKKSIEVLSNSKAYQWCYVDTNNKFKFMGKEFIIDNSVEEYRVYNKAGEVDDFTNEAYMEEILVVLHNDGFLKFYNQNYELIDNKYIRVIIE